MNEQQRSDETKESSLSDEALQKALAECEARLSEIRNAAKDESIRKDLDSAEDTLRACRRELDERESAADENAWLEAKHGIVTKLNDVQKNLQLTKRRMADYIR